MRGQVFLSATTRQLQEMFFTKHKTVTAQEHPSWLHQQH
jgi:hypothetical protein